MMPLQQHPTKGHQCGLRQINKSSDILKQIQTKPCEDIHNLDLPHATYRNTRHSTTSKGPPLCSKTHPREYLSPLSTQSVKHNQTITLQLNKTSNLISSKNLLCIALIPCESL